MTNNTITLDTFLESMMILNDRITSDACSIFNNDISDDDSDYMPARANFYAALTYLIFAMRYDELTPDAALASILDNRDSILDDYMTIDIALPLDEFIPLD